MKVNIRGGWAGMGMGYNHLTRMHLNIWSFEFLLMFELVLYAAIEHL